MLPAWGGALLAWGVALAEERVALPEAWAAAGRRRMKGLEVLGWAGGGACREREVMLQEGVQRR